MEISKHINKIIETFEINNAINDTLWFNDTTTVIEQLFFIMYDIEKLQKLYNLIKDMVKFDSNKCNEDECSFIDPNEQHRTSMYCILFNYDIFHMKYERCQQCKDLFK